MRRATEWLLGCRTYGQAQQRARACTHADIGLRAHWSIISPRIEPQYGRRSSSGPADTAHGGLGQLSDAAASGCHQRSVATYASTRQPTTNEWLRRRSGTCDGRSAAAAADGDRRPLAAWVRRFRQGPPLPRAERMPYTLHPSDGGAAVERDMQRELERSADALLEEARRAIACLDPATGAARSAGTLDRAAAQPAAHALVGGSRPSSRVDEPSRKAAAGANKFRAAEPMGSAPRQWAGTPPCSVWALEALQAQEFAQGTPAKSGGCGREDGEDLLERWRRRRRAQEVTVLLVPSEYKLCANR